MRKTLICAWITLLVCITGTGATFSDEHQGRLVELNAYWDEVSRAVREGDFEGYRATCHDEGVLVSGVSQTSYPLAKALARWKQGFVDTQAGKLKASVEFRFSQRIGDETTAHETGIFRYSTEGSEEGPDAARKVVFIHFDGLLVKKKDGWKMMMEHQKSETTQQEWEALKKPVPRDGVK